MITYNQTVQLINNIANAHLQVHSFGVGELDEVEGALEADKIYPKVWLAPVNSTVGENTVNNTFNLLCFDLVKKDIGINENEVLSDTQQILYDIIKVLKDGAGPEFDILGDVTLTPFTEKFGDFVTGWNAAITIETDFEPNSCGLPIEAFSIPSGVCADCGGTYAWLTCSTLAGCTTFSALEARVTALEDNALSSDIVDALNNADAPTSANPFATIADLSSGIDCDDVAACPVIVSIQGDITNLENDLAAETLAREAGDAFLQDQIDNLPPPVTPNLDAVLTAGNLTGEKFMTSDNGVSKLGLFNINTLLVHSGVGQAQVILNDSRSRIDYDDGSGIGGNLDFLNASVTLAHTVSIILDSPSITAQGLTIGKGNGLILTNTGFGIDVLSSITTGSSNTAIGYEALKSNQGTTGNTAIGRGALKNHNQFDGNTAIGYNTLTAQTSGQFNVAIGYNAMPSNLTGNGNLALGTNAMISSTIGSDNTAIGYSALFSMLSGTDNIAIGKFAMVNATSGPAQNTVIGDNAGGAIINQANNTIIGYTAGSTFIGSDCTIIGRGINLPANGDGQLAIGANGISMIRGASTGAITIPNLAGTGTQMVVADINGVLSKQAIPTSSVTSVNGFTGTVVLTTTDIAEGTNLYYTNSRADARIALQRNAVNGLAGLDGSGLIFASQLPSIAITDTFVVASQAAMLALSTAETGDVAIRTDISKTFILSGTYSVLADWKELLTPTDSVLSVFGRTGSVVAASGDYNTSQVTELTNLYFTNARAVSAMAGLYEVPLTFSTGLTRTVNTITVNTTQNILKLSNLTSNGFVKTSGGDGTLSIDTSTYLTANQTITLSGQATGSGTTGITVTLDNAAVIAKTLTGYTSGAGVITASDSILSAIQKLNGNIGAIVSGVSSVNGFTGAVTLTTTNITEGSNLYYTNARVNTQVATYTGDVTLTGTTFAIGTSKVLNSMINSVAWSKVTSTPTTISGYGITDTINQLLTGYTSGAGTITSSDSILTAIQKLNGNTVALVTGVSSVNTLTGAVVLTTTNITEGSNLYFTNARSIASTLTTYSSTTGTISTSDTIVGAISKLNGNIAALDKEVINKEITFDGQGGVITVNSTVTFTIPFTGTITGWTLLETSDTPIASTVTLDAWKDSYANYPPTVADTIFGTKPSLSGAIKNQSGVLAIAVTAGDIIKVNADSITSAIRLKLIFNITRS